MSDNLADRSELEELIRQSKKKANRSFWAFVIILPLFLVTCISAAPDWINKFGAFTAGVKGDSLAEAQRQASLWQRNSACLGQPFKGVMTENNLRVDATVCPSGDVLIQVRRPDNVQVFRWVSVDSVVQGATIIPSAQQ